MNDCGSIQNFEAPTEFSTSNENDLRDGASSAAVAKNIAPNTFGQLEDFQELLLLSDNNRTQHFNIREGGASSNGAANIKSPGQIEVTAPNGKKKQEKSKARSKSNKKKGNTKPEQKEATPTFMPSKPRHFIGFYVCKEYNGARILGTVASCSYKKNLLKVEYDDNRKEYLEQREVLKNAAKKEDIEEAQQALQRRKNSQKTAGKRKRASGEGSSTPRKRRNISGNKKVPYRASRIMPSFQ